MTLVHPALTPEHAAARETMRRFVAREIAPHAAAWDDAARGDNSRRSAPRYASQGRESRWAAGQPPEGAAAGGHGRSPVRSGPDPANRPPPVFPYVRNLAPPR